MKPLPYSSTPNGDGIFETVLSTIGTGSSSTGANHDSQLDWRNGKLGATLRINAIAGAGEDVRIDNLNISYTSPNLLLNGTNDDNIIVGNGDGSTIDGGEGNDIVFAGAGDDTVVWNASGGNGNGPSDGHDIIDGGEGTVDRFVINGNNTAETYRVYTAVEAALAGITGLKSGTEIVITRNGTNTASVIAELDNVEEITINTSGGNGTGGNAGGDGDSVQVIGNFNPTSLAFNTITVNGGEGDDTVDISGLESEHRVVLNSGGGADSIIGGDRPQDIINVTAAGDAGNSGDTDEDTDEPDVEGDTSEYENEDEDDDDNDSDDTGSGSGSPAHLPLNLIGDGTANLLAGAAGDDIAMGNAGDDMLTTAGGNDMSFGGAGEDTLITGDGNDMAYGEAGNDRLFAGDGNDMVDGGAGDDTAMGGSGDDLFIAAVNDGNDAYYGDAGTDTLNMSAIIDRIEANLGTGFSQRWLCQNGQQL